MISKSYKICNCCGETKELAAFPIAIKNADGSIKNYRGNCKACHVINSYNLEIERKMELKPDSYFECVKCENYTSIRRHYCRVCGEKR